MAGLIVLFWAGALILAGFLVYGIYKGFEAERRLK